MNEKLFYSSIIIGSLIIYISLQFYTEELMPIYILTYIGIITSIMNHGIFDYIVSKNVIKIVDRGFMCILSIIYLYYYLLMEDSFLKQSLLYIILLMGFLFFLSKVVKPVHKELSAVHKELSAIHKELSAVHKELSVHIHMTVHIFALFAFTVITMYTRSSNDIIAFL